MSRENVEVVRRAAEAFNRHDIGALAELSHDDLEFVSVLTAVDAGGATYSGPEVWATYFARMDEVWDGWRVENVEIFDADGDRVAAVFHIAGKGKASGIPSNARSVWRTGSGRASCGRCVPTSNRARPSKP